MTEVLAFWLGYHTVRLFWALVSPALATLSLLAHPIDAAMELMDR